jgi:D-alanyl-D-alanine carboxypeptidase (penicillin-binding protein 5/6)
MRYFRLFLLIFLSISSSAKAEAMSKYLQEAQFYFLIDADTKEVLLSKNADVQIAPSSMTKLMTAYVVFDQIQKGRIGFDSQCIIGKDAWHKSGTTMFLNYGDVVSIDQLLKGLLVVSGNDAAVALAESSAGGINNFVDLMNLKAKQLGMKNSQFRNPHGLNEKGHYMSIRDLATLATRLYQDFPQYSHYFGIPEFTYRNITQRNRNPLIRENYDGVVGGKTGYTGDGGYGITAMVKRNHRRLIAVVNKAKTPKQRSHIITDLLDYGFGNYKKLIIFEKDHVVAELPTWLGKRSKVEAVINQEVALNVPRERPLDAIRVSVKYKNPLYAPIKRGDKIGDLIVDIKGYKTFSYPLFAKEKIDKAGPLRRIAQIIKYKVSDFYNKISN